MAKSDHHRLVRIGKISKIYGVPVSTLHYWEKEGLIAPTHNAQNNYSEFDVGVMFAELGDVLFYRDIGMPLEDIKKLRKISSAELQKLLEKVQSNIAKEIEHSKKKLIIIQERLSYLREITEADGEFQKKPIHFRRVAKIDPLNSLELVEKYLTDMNRFVVIGNLGEDGVVEEDNCLIVDEDFPGETILIENKDTTYLMTYCRLQFSPDEQFKVKDLVQKLNTLGYTTKQYICQFLINMCDKDGVQYDYYRIWFKIEK